MLCQSHFGVRKVLDAEDAEDVAALRVVLDDMEDEMYEGYKEKQSNLNSLGVTDPAGCVIDSPGCHAVWSRLSGRGTRGGAHCGAGGGAGGCTGTPAPRAAALASVAEGKTSPPASSPAAPPAAPPGDPKPASGVVGGARG